MFQSTNKKLFRQFVPMLRQINQHEQWASKQSKADCLNFTNTLKQHANKPLPIDLQTKAFALVRSIALHILKERIYDAQMLGALALHQGVVVEMKTGEGKTISSVPALYINAINGNGIHVVTVNDYLAERDAQWMRGIFEYLGISVGYIVSNMENRLRKSAYDCDITYGTNNEFGFDYLRDNMQYARHAMVQRGHNFCIIDEVDSILIDEARTPLIISGVTDDDVSAYRVVNTLATRLKECEKDQETEEYPENPQGDYKVDEKNKHISFTDQGIAHIEQLLQAQKIIDNSLYANENFKYVHHFVQALRAQRLYRKERDYVVDENRVKIVDEFTGRILTGRRYSDGLHQAIEAKEGIHVAKRSKTMATITLQNYFRLYKKISGMTGTATTEEKEFGKIYGLAVVEIPTNRPVIRIDHNDLIYADEQSKYQAIIEWVTETYNRGQPVLIGTTTIESSERLSQALKRNRLEHAVLNAKNHAREAYIIAQAGCAKSITIATNMAGRGTDIKLGGDTQALSNNQTEQLPAQQLDAQRASHNSSPYHAVKERGGLCVIGTERHDSRRIDNQLRGRSGRQGDPGVSQFFLSMDDQLMRLFGGRREFLKSMMMKGLGSDQAINHPLINKSIARAQKRVEERNFEIRKHLLEFDDVINEQRVVIFGQRNEILEDDALTTRLVKTAQTATEHELALFKKQQDSQQLLSALEQLCEHLLFDRNLFKEINLALPFNTVLQAIGALFAEDLQNKERIIGKERFNLAIRHAYIRQIDQRWQEHLEALDALREAVYLRSYAQKNPLLEYKIEGFQLFDSMVEEIRIAVARRFYAIRIERVAAQNLESKLATAEQVTAHHRSLNQFGALAASSSQTPIRRSAQPMSGSVPSSAVAQANRPATSVVRGSVKVGRNESCPCGSGKKYKFCHGR